jgi:hypothetical protein
VIGPPADCGIDIAALPARVASEYSWGIPPMAACE